MTKQIAKDTMPRFTATYLWPGSFLNETESVRISEGTVQSALAAMPPRRMYGSYAFGFEISEAVKLFTASDGEQRWLPDGPQNRIGRWYFGELLHIEDVEVRNTNGQYDILLSNMRGNDWSAAVETIAGNFQPIEEGDVVLPASAHPHLMTEEAER